MHARGENAGSRRPHARLAAWSNPFRTFQLISFVFVVLAFSGFTPTCFAQVGGEFGAASIAVNSDSVLPTRAGRKRKRLYLKAPPESEVQRLLPQIQPCPLPKASASYSYPDRFMERYRGKSLQFLVEELEAWFADADYTNTSYFSCGRGVVIVLPIEKISLDGAPIVDGRFAVGHNGVSSIADYFYRLLHSDVGRYRAIVFKIAVDNSRENSSPSLEFKKLREWISEGQRRPNFASRVFTKVDQLSVDIYEYIVEKKADPIFVPSSYATVVDHLRRTRLPSGAPR